MRTGGSSLAKANGQARSSSAPSSRPCTRSAMLHRSVRLAAVPPGRAGRYRSWRNARRLLMCAAASSTPPQAVATPCQSSDSFNGRYSEAGSNRPAPTLASATDRQRPCRCSPAAVLAIANTEASSANSHSQRDITSSRVIAPCPGCWNERSAIIAAGTKASSRGRTMQWAAQASDSQAPARSRWGCQRAEVGGWGGALAGVVGMWSIMLHSNNWSCPP